MLKRYVQIICDRCGEMIDNIEPNVKPTIKNIRSRGIICYKGNHYCSYCWSEEGKNDAP